jgi:hypothetical protein
MLLVSAPPLSVSNKPAVYLTRTILIPAALCGGAVCQDGLTMSFPAFEDETASQKFLV